jgi:hypothetical protein
MNVGSVVSNKLSNINGLQLAISLVWFNGSQLVTKRIKLLPVLERFVNKLDGDTSICVMANLTPTTPF